ncbi:MAG: hypothetical protein N3H31_05355 [Candidatus Nezhaarchaeota archaeon]|nr:hypothetical protein [Candidatus Nezhaarchaeota archaeon]
MKTSARRVAFIAMMGALSNAMFAISITILNWGQVALDLSHMGTLIAAMYGGASAGLVVGGLAGIGGGLYFGSVSGLLHLYLPGFIAGKALTGLSVGALSRAFNLHRSKRSVKALIATLLGYVPECLFTVAFFLIVIPIFAPRAATFLMSLLVPILIKAWIEMFIMGFYMAALIGNQGFTQLVERLWPPTVVVK